MIYVAHTPSCAADTVLVWYLYIQGEILPSQQLSIATAARAISHDAEKEAKFGKQSEKVVYKL